jgi:hypothetical protein
MEKDPDSCLECNYCTNKKCRANNNISVYETTCCPIIEVVSKKEYNKLLEEYNDLKQSYEHLKINYDTATK